MLSTQPDLMRMSFTALQHISSKLWRVRGTREPWSKLPRGLQIKENKKHPHDMHLATWMGNSVERMVPRRKKTKEGDSPGEATTLILV